MAAYLVQEPWLQYTRLFDQRTQGTIFCTGRQHAENELWCSDTVGNDCPKIDVTKTIPFLRSDSMAFTHDTFVDNTKRSQEKFCGMLVDFACLVHLNLLKHKKVLVYCKNGRSRSPNVVLALFLLRGLPREQATKWLRRAFMAQRPNMASKSIGNFPNFSKFTNITFMLERWYNGQCPILLNRRIQENFHQFPAIHAGLMQQPHIGEQDCFVADGSLPPSAYCLSKAALARLEKEEGLSYSKRGRVLRSSQSPTKSVPQKRYPPAQVGRLVVGCRVVL